jgi:drug/metabolite transporter (DMT)-like permease
MSIYLLIAVLFWGFSYIAIKTSLNYLTPIELIAARLLLGSVTLFIIIRIKKLPLSLNGQLKTVLFASFILFLHFWVMATGMMYTSATNTAWILTTAPIFIVFLSAIFLRERLRSRHMISIILASIGIILLVSKGDLRSLGWLKSIGDWIVLGSCLTWAIYTLAIRNATNKINPLVLTFWMILIAGLVIIPYSLYTSGIAVYYDMPLDGTLAVVFLGIGCLAISFWAWSQGLARKPAAEVGIYLYLEPLFAMTGAYFLLHEKITAGVIFGAVIIIAAVYISERKKSARPVSG